MKRALVALGSNIDPREDHLEFGLERLEGLPVTSLVRASSWYETTPLGHGYGKPFLNGVALLKTGLAAQDLMQRLLDVEQSLGRGKVNRRGDRSLDLDLLDHGGSVVESPDMVLPHPRMLWRPFVLVPLFEVLPNWVHPRCGIGVGTLIGRHRNLQHIRWSARGPELEAQN